MSSSSVDDQLAKIASITPLSRSDVLAESIVQQIMDLILTGVLQPGDKLAEVALAEQFGVSRIPVREALGKLDSYGLVCKKPYQPAEVSSVTDEDLEALHEVRVLMEPQAAKTLALHGTAEDLATLQGILRDMEAAATSDNQRAMIQLDLKLHNSMVTLNQNSLINEMWSLASIRLHRFLLLKRRRTYPNLHAAVAQHRPIVEAIVARRGDEAAEQIHHHLMNVYCVWQEDPCRAIPGNE